jgi:hypothetical protein
MFTTDCSRGSNTYTSISPAVPEEDTAASMHVHNLRLKVFQRFLEWLRQAKPVPLCKKRGHVPQCVAATVLGGVLPGSRTDAANTNTHGRPSRSRDPALDSAVALLGAVTLHSTVQRHGLAGNHNT